MFSLGGARPEPHTRLVQSAALSMQINLDVVLEMFSTRLCALRDQ